MPTLSRASDSDSKYTAVMRTRLPLALPKVIWQALVLSVAFPSLIDLSASGGTSNKAASEPKCSRLQQRKNELASELWLLDASHDLDWCPRAHVPCRIFCRTKVIWERTQSSATRSAISLGYTRRCGCLFDRTVAVAISPHDLDQVLASSFRYPKTWVNNRSFGGKG